MCILFIKLLKAKTAGEFKLILAANRDEFFKRPATSAHFWEEDFNIFGGRDMTQGKEGGTWLAMSKKGKLGVLLNVSGAKEEPSKEARGFLIAEYLKNSFPTKEYLERLKQTAQNYNKFHLVTASFRNEPNLFHLSNGEECYLTEIQSETFAIGNSPLEKPYLKVRRGKSKFEEICAKYGRLESKDELVKELLSLLKWDEKHYPDEVIENLLNVPESKKRAVSSVYVSAPEVGYGTRAHTIVLVDWNNNVEFHEWSLEDPITAEHMKWRETHEKFQLLN